MRARLGVAFLACVASHGLLACAGTEFSAGASADRDGAAGGSATGGSGAGGDTADAGGGGGSGAGGSSAGGAASGGAAGAGGGTGAGGSSSGGADGGSTGGVSSGGAGGTAAGGAGGTAAGGTGGVGVVDAGGCDLPAPTGEAIYVRLGASDQDPTGSARAPFPTLKAGLQAALDAGISQVYLGPGTYPGQAIVGFSKEVTITGGWVVAADGTWSADCAADPRARTIIAATSAAEPGLNVHGNQATVRLEHLSVRTVDAATAQSGVAGSLFAIVARGSGSSLTLALDDVAVYAGRGADGVAAEAVGQSGNRVCDGKSTCTDSPTPGASSPPGAGAVLGTFSASGYVPGDGKQGNHGGDGTEGMPGGDGTTCTGCFGGCIGAIVCTVLTGQSITGSTGSCGCGGLGGPPGNVGRGGGASVALLLADGAKVTATASTLKSGRGGDASPGGPGGLGGPGTAGVDGTSLTCATAASTSCSGAPSCSTITSKEYCTAEGGAAGGNGQPGAPGATGGGGWGGPSFAVVTVGASTFDAAQTTLLYGSSGKNGDTTAPAGNAGTILAQ